MKQFTDKSQKMFFITYYMLFILIKLSDSFTLNKCCFQNEVLDISEMKCRLSGLKTWEPTFYEDTESQTNVPPVSYELKEKRSPKCPETGVHLFPIRDLPEISALGAKFRILTTGKVVAQHTLGHWVDVPSYCVDGIQNYVGGETHYTGDELDQVLVTCPVKREE